MRLFSGRSAQCWLLMVLLAFVLFLPAAWAAPGDIGDVCASDGWCDAGVCINGLCQVCGRPGDRCCPGNVCYYASEGYSCNNAGYCINPNDPYEVYCGHAGRPQCSWAPGTCYSGYPWNGMCIACGDYYQPCCPDTAYECDYGDCVNGTCVPTSSSTTNPPGGSDTTDDSSWDWDDEDHHHDDDDDDSESSCFIQVIKTN